jgi:hypothetical protein
MNMTTPSSVQRIRVVRGYRALARFMAELTAEPIGEIPRRADIRTPYAYAPTHVVYGLGERRVFIAETAHKKYEVFEVLS